MPDPVLIEPGVYQISYSSESAQNSHYEDQLIRAQRRLKTKIHDYPWTEHLQTPLATSAEIFSERKDFIKRWKTLQAHTIPTPSVLGIGLKKGVLFSVIPEVFIQDFPQAQDIHAFEKLLTYQLAQELHLRLVKYKLHHRGPAWFYQGFASYLANQFPYQQGDCSQAQVWKILKGNANGNLKMHNQIIRYFLKKTELKNLVKKSKRTTFIDELELLEY